MGVYLFKLIEMIWLRTGSAMSLMRAPENDVEKRSQAGFYIACILAQEIYKSNHIDLGLYDHYLIYNVKIFFLPDSFLEANKK